MVRGWRLTGWLAAFLAGASLLIAGFADVQAVIRFTARTSFVLFCLTFSAAALYRVWPHHWPHDWPRWQRQNRRYLGVSFAVSHLIHAIALVAFARLDPAQFRAATDLGMFVGGGLAYVFIALMAATSFDRTASWLGPRAWRILHWTGSWYIALSFLLAFGKRIPGNA